MPGFIGKKLCPDLVIVKSSFDKYQAVSKQVREIFACYDPNYSPMSLDEAYLDLTEHLVKRQSMPDEQRSFPKRLEDEKLCQCKKENIKNSKSADEKVDSDTNVDKDAMVESKEEIPSDSGIKGDTDSLKEGEEVTECRECGKAVDGEGLGEMVMFGLTADEAVKEMRFRIEHKTKLTASAGNVFFLQN